MALPDPSKEWYKKRLQEEDGCDVTAGSLDLDEPTETMGESWTLCEPARRHLYGRECPHIPAGALLPRSGFGCDACTQKLIEDTEQAAIEARDIEWCRMLGFEAAGTPGNTPEFIRRELAAYDDEPDTAVAVKRAVEAESILWHETCQGKRNMHSDDRVKAVADLEQEIKARR